MKLITWNIQTGGSGGRLASVLELLTAERPDLVAIQELRGFRRRQTAGLADELGMTAVLAPSAFGMPVAVLVRPPLTVTRSRRMRWGLHHAAAAATVATSVGELTLVSAHLNPYRPGQRLREARLLAHRFPDPLTLLAGDLNSLDPGTDHDDRLARLDLPHRRRHLGPDGGPDTRAVAALRAEGFHDLWGTAGRGSGLTVPTGHAGGEFSTAGMRLDYVLARPAAAALVTQARVLRGAVADRASDHYPLLVTLDVGRNQSSAATS